MLFSVFQTGKMKGDESFLSIFEKPVDIKGALTLTLILVNIKHQKGGERDERWQ